MQISRIVAYHRALGDLTRVQIVALLQNGPLHGQAIAGKLGLKPPTITHHMAKLREAGLIKERRKKNTIYFSLDEKALASRAQAILTLGKKGSHPDLSVTETERATIVNNFFDADGKLKMIPAQRKKRLAVLSYIVRGFELGKVYTEKEVSAYLRQFHEDYATLRRELIVYQFMYRKDGKYKLNPPELWWQR